MHLDHRGILWVGTHEGGLVRFNGTRFEVFTTREGLPGNGIFSLIEDGEGYLWVGTNRGLCRYDGRAFAPFGGLHHCLWGRGVDRDGRLWFSIADQAALYCWDGTALRRFEVAELLAAGGLDVHPEKEGKAGHAWTGETGIRQIMTDRQGTLWFCGAGLYRWDGAEFTGVISPAQMAGRAWSMTPRADGELWFWIGSEGLFRLEQDRLVPLDRVSTPPVGFDRALWEEEPGVLWLLRYWNGPMWRYCGQRLEEIRPSPKCVHAECTPCRDSAGRIWFGTYGHGLHCYDQRQFQIYLRDQDLPEGRGGVYHLHEDDWGRIWVRTPSGMAVVAEEKCRPVESAGEWPVEELRLDGEEGMSVNLGRIWVYQSGRFHPLLPELNRGCIYAARDSQGGIWFGSWEEEGLGYYRDGEVVYVDPDIIGRINYLGGLLVDRRDRVWFGISLPNLGRDDRRTLGCLENGEVRYFGIEDGFTGEAVYALYEDDQDRIWIGTGQGVFIFDGRTFTHFTRVDGMPHQVVTAIDQTADGITWLGTAGAGVICFDGRVFQQILIPGGSSARTIHALRADRAGDLWCGTPEGLVRYRRRRAQPWISIKQVEADRVYPAAEQVEISTNAGRLSLHFEGGSPDGPTAPLVYRYRLEGRDATWRQTREDRVEYPPLEPGPYTFQVQAVDPDLNYSAIASVQVDITADPRMAGLTRALGDSLHEFVGRSPALQQVHAQLIRVASTDLTVLIYGETGTGKGLAARFLHAASDRAQGPFMPVNCGAIPEGLIESALFGHEKGAFTGATTRQLGKFELAEGGTLFLDEIGDLPLGMQQTLLQILQEKTFQRVGGHTLLHADVRVVAATNRDLRQAIEEGQFRQDLYYRLGQFELVLPPLRQRQADIPLLVEHFACRFARHLHQPVPSIDPAVLAALQRYEWPGNVRELEHLVQRLVLLLSQGGYIGQEHLTGLLPPNGGLHPHPAPSITSGVGLADDGVPNLNETLAAVEHQLIEAALEQAQGNKTRAAELLGVDRKIVERRLKKYGL